MRYRTVIGIYVVILIISIVIFLRAGSFLVVNQAPRGSDVIVVLAGGSENRVKLGIELFKQGFGANMLFSGKTPIARNITAAESMAVQSERSGVPKEKIVLEDKSTSTYENAIFTKQLLEISNYKSAIIVTSNYHMRRTMLVFNKAFKDTDIKLTYCASEDKSFKPNGWYTDNYSSDLVFSEYIKTVGYWVEGRL